MGKNKTIIKGFKSPEIEQLSEIVEDTKKQIGNLEDVGSDIFKQIMGFSLGANSGHESAQANPQGQLEIQDLITGGGGDIFHASKHKASNERASMKHPLEKGPRNEKREGALDHANDILKVSERASHTEMREINQRLQSIMSELQRLISSSNVLKMEFADVNLDRPPAQAGEYHINFFDWLLLTIRAARQKVEDSGAWLKAVKGKNSKAHWGKISKKGTNTHVTLSNERSVATQAG